MSRSDSNRIRLPKGVAAIPVSRGGRSYRASIRRGKEGEVHLGLYETPWLAAFAFGVAAELLGRAAPPLEIPRAEQPDAEEVRSITARVRRRLGFDPETIDPRHCPPDPEGLRILFGVAIVGFWRQQVATDAGDHPEAGLDAAAARLLDAARLLFWDRPAGHPDPAEVLADLAIARFHLSFRRADLVREVLDDDGDDPDRLARWLVLPDAVAGGRLRGFREEVRHLYIDPFEDDDPEQAPPAWASVLGIGPPFDADGIRAAFRLRSRTAHPDAGGSEADFVRLRAAYEAALAACAERSR